MKMKYLILLMFLISCNAPIEDSEEVNMDLYTFRTLRSCDNVTFVVDKAQIYRNLSNCEKLRDSNLALFPKGAIIRYKGTEYTPEEFIFCYSGYHPIFD